MPLSTGGSFTGVTVSTIHGWSLDVLLDTVRETLDLAKIRTVDIGDLPLDDLASCHYTERDLADHTHDERRCKQCRSRPLGGNQVEASPSPVR